jgi:hypothetical protein
MNMAFSRGDEVSGKFEKDVPDSLQEDVLQRIEECAWGFVEDPEIEITDLEKRNALNIEYTGVIRIEGVEHAFHIRSGDNAGTEILAWNGAGEVRRDPPEITTLVPLRSRSADAIHDGRAADLLREWAEALDPATESGRRLHGLPAAAAYDAFFAPSTGASRSHRETARKAGFEIEEMDVAIKVRRELLDAAFPIVPFRLNRDSLEILEEWDALLRGETEADREILSLRSRLIEAIALRGGVEPGLEETVRMQETGFAFCTRAERLRTRVRLTRNILALDPIGDFDPASLPENPVAVLFNRLDPALAPDVRVDPAIEGLRLLEATADAMARKGSLALPDGVQARAAAIGFRLLNRADPYPETKFEPAPKM